MNIRELLIENFRGIQSGRIQFGDFTVIVGANNCGKTTIIEALALLLGRDRLVKDLTEHDFFGSAPTSADRIRIVATITGFTPNDPAQHLDWFRMGRSVIKWRNPATGELKPTQNGHDDELACQIAFCGRFDKETLNVETVRYFYDDSAQLDPFDEDGNAIFVPLNLIKELGLFLVPANRTWDRMMSFGSELFRRVVAYVGGQPADAVLTERDRLRSPAKPLEDDEKLRDLVDKVNDDIAGLFGRHTKLKLRLTPTDSEGVLDAVVPHFAEGGGVALPARRHGSGLISLQTLILLLRFGNLRIAKGESFLMAIEEPELHVPPPLQRKLLHLMQSLATQTIVTTHSPTVAAIPPPHKLVLVANDGGALRARPLLDRPLATSATNLERGMFLSDRETTVSAIMHPRVIIPEGKTDASWLRLLAHLADLASGDAPSGQSVSFTHEVGVIPTKDARVVDVFKLLELIHPSVACLIDGDAQGNEYMQQLVRLDRSPKVIIRWPAGWTIEHVIGWIVSADASILGDQQLSAEGIPTSVQELTSALSATLKVDDIAHGLLADAISGSAACMQRVRHVLKVIGDILTSRAVAAHHATFEKTANGTTMVWTFIHVVQGL